MGRILRAAWDERGHRPLPEPAFMSHLATVLVMMARDARGVAWSPLSLVAEHLQAGQLDQLGGPADEVRIEIHLFRPRARQPRAAERFWERLLEHVAQAPRN